ncbi:hypothetical protein BH23BAC1_BH23BAC1_18190 [soil metagenome]
MKTKLKLSPRVAPKVNVITTLIYAGVGIALGSILGIIAFIYLNIGSPEEAKANTTYTSRAGGNWTLAATWDGSRPNLTLTNKEEVRINAGHEVFVETNVLFQQNTTLKVWGTLVVQGNLTMEQLTNLYVYPGGILIVMGDYSALQHLEFTNGGKIVLLQNITTTLHSSITNSGAIYADAPLAISSGNAQQSESAIQNDIQLMSLLTIYGYAPVVMPVSLLSFSGEIVDEKVNLTWSTASETDNDFFTVERGTDGENFETIAKVIGAGSSQLKLDYSYTDHLPLKDRSYYRLKQTDFNGQFEYFTPITVLNIKSQSELKLASAGPNPFSDYINILFEADAGQLELHLINARGELVFSEVITAQAGFNQHQLLTGQKLPQEMYFLRLIQKGKSTKPLRMIKK